MKHFLLTWLGTAVALIITAHIVNNFIANSFIIKNFPAALIATVVVGLVNAFIRPILGILAFPVTLITFGLFTFVLNALALWLASALTPANYFTINGFVPALLGSIVLSIVSSLISYVLRVVE